MTYYIPKQSKIQWFLELNPKTHAAPSHGSVVTSNGELLPAKAGEFSIGACQPFAAQMGLGAQSNPVRGLLRRLRSRKRKQRGGEPLAAWFLALVRRNGLFPPSSVHVRSIEDYRKSEFAKLKSIAHTRSVTLRGNVAKSCAKTLYLFGAFRFLVQISYL
jgi:hypothetical protein